MSSPVCPCQLCDVLEEELRGGGCLVDFHSTSSFPIRWFPHVVVLRASTHVLFDRLARRGYPPLKVQENVEAEIMQVVLDEVREGWEDSQITQLTSDTVEQMEDNCSRCCQWLEQWKRDHPPLPLPSPITAPLVRPDLSQ